MGLFEKNQLKISHSVVRYYDLSIKEEKIFNDSKALELKINRDIAGTSAVAVSFVIDSSRKRSYQYLNRFSSSDGEEDIRAARAWLLHRSRGLKFHDLNHLWQYLGFTTLL